MITATGIGSGLDIEGLVNQLVSAERAPTETRLARKESALKAEISAFGAFKSVLSNFADALGTLVDIASFSQKTGAVSKSDILSAQVSQNAQPGQYNIVVNQLAASHSLASGAVAAIDTALGTGTLTIRFGTTDYDVDTDTYNGFTPDGGMAELSLQIDAQNNSLAGIRDAINQADAGVSAAIVNDGNGYRLLLISDNTGVGNSLEISVAGDDDGNDLDNSGLSFLAFNSQATHMQQTGAARNASLSLNGLAVTSAGNRITDLVDGVTLDLKAASVAPVTLTIAEDQTVVQDKIKAFVDAYNGLIGRVNQLTSYNPATGVAGILQGDIAVRSLVNQVQQVMTSTVADLNAPFRTLSDIGISTGDKGILALDTAKLEAALAGNPEAMAGLFGAGDTAAETGIASRLQALLGGWLTSGGVLDERTNGLELRVASIADSMAALERRMTTVEARYRAQFNALDSLMSQLQNTSSFLSQQLAALPGAAPVNGKSKR